MQRCELVWSEEEIAEEVKLGLEAGDSLDDMAERLGISAYAVAAHIRSIEEAREALGNKGRPPSELPASYSLLRLRAIVKLLGGPAKAARASGVNAGSLSGYLRGGRPSVGSWAKLEKAAAAHPYDSP